MAIELRRFRGALVEEISRCLDETVVYGNVLVSTWSMRGLRTVQALPKSGPVADALYGWVGDRPLLTFVSNEVARNFVPGEFDGGKEAPLSSFSGYEDLKKVAGDLVDSMGSLPWQYSLTMRLPSSLIDSFPKEVGCIQITDRQRVVTGQWLKEQGFPSEDRPRGLLALMGGVHSLGSRYWPPDRLYLQVLVEGYLGDSTTESYQSALETMQTILGLAFSFGIFSEFAENYGDKRDFNDWVRVVHLLQEGAWVEVGEHAIGENHKRKLSEIVADGMDSSGPTSLGARLESIGEILGSPHGTKIARASRWLFESRCHEDPLHQFIHAAVAMEILLGDEKPPEGVGVTQLLANRCAYLISKTPDDRERTLKVFKKIYDLRSSIVHTGKGRLNRAESMLLVHLRMLCDRVIFAEHALIQTDLQRAKTKREIQ